nr:uncharacterized protein LOC112131960 [Pongo abelii]
MEVTSALLIHVILGGIMSNRFPSKPWCCLSPHPRFSSRSEGDGEFRSMGLCPALGRAVPAYSAIPKASVAALVQVSVRRWLGVRVSAWPPQGGDSVLNPTWQEAWLFMSLSDPPPTSPGSRRHHRLPLCTVPRVPSSAPGTSGGPGSQSRAVASTSQSPSPRRRLNARHPRAPRRALTFSWADTVARQPQTLAWAREQAVAARTLGPGGAPAAWPPSRR